MSDQHLKELLQRRKQFGKLGALDFMIQRERQRLRRDSHRHNSSAEPAIVTARNKKCIGQAAETYRLSGAEEALAFLEEKQLEHYPISHLLRANKSLDSDSSWLAGLNGYLQLNDQDTIGLRAGKQPRIFRLNGKSKQQITDGPKISVIMPAFNSENTLALAADSILNQAWRNIELIIVDDCSTDRTWSVCKQIADKDHRVMILHNSSNVGPYVSKNRALRHTSGEWVTGHDADDWAMPNRLMDQAHRMIRDGSSAEVGHMLRIKKNGEFSHLGRVTSFSPDGCRRVALISTIFRRDFLINRLGAWDSVRFGADSELVARAEVAEGKPLPRRSDVTMICLDEASNLTNHPEFGLSRISGPSLPRKKYKESWLAWHGTISPESAFLVFPHFPRQFDAPPQAIVAEEAISNVINGDLSARVTKSGAF